LLGGIGGRDGPARTHITQVVTAEQLVGGLLGGIGGRDGITQVVTVEQLVGGSLGGIGGRDGPTRARITQVVTTEQLVGGSLGGIGGRDGPAGTHIIADIASIQCGISGGGITGNNVSGGVHTSSVVNITNKSAGIARLRGATMYMTGAERAGAVAAARTRMATQDTRIVL